MQGVRPGVPWASSPALTGVRPSTSLAGSIVPTTVSGSIWSGSGSCDQDPVDRVVEAEAGDEVEQVLLRGVGGEAMVDRGDPDLLAGAVLVADVDLGGGVIADKDGRQRRRPPSLGDVGLDLDGDPLANRGGDRLAIDHRAANRYRFLIGA